MTVFRAPATSANIGAGFDTAAVAFDLWNELELTDGAGVTVEGEGATELPADDSNLAVRAYALLADPAGKHFHFTNRIPLERGLGSSAAAIALGLVAAAPTASAEELLAVGITLEPHADNLAAALLGGLTLSWDGRIARIAERLPLAAVAVVPRERTSTESSRKTLPATVPHDEAAASAGRAALLGAGAASGDASTLLGRAQRLAPRAVPPVRDALGDSHHTACRLRRRDAVGVGADRDRLGHGRGCVCRRPPAPLPRPRDPRAGHCTAGRAVSVVLVDVRPRADYEAGHVPGAVHLDPETDLSAIGPDPADGGRHPLPDDAQLARVFGRAGIGPEDFVLALDDGSGWAARCWWLLRHLGHDEAGAIDVRGYVGPLSTEAVEPDPTEFQARPREDDTITAEEILARLGDPSLLLLDARSRVRWLGEEEPLDPVAGRIPGAANAPFTEPLPAGADGGSRARLVLRLRRDRLCHSPEAGARRPRRRPSLPWFVQRVVPPGELPHRERNSVTTPYDRPSDPAKRHSSALTDGPDRAGARSMLKATGFTDEDLAKPIVGVGTTWIETMPCNLNQRDLAVHVKRGVRDAGGTPMEFNTVAVSDGVSMGTSGMRASLVSREVIADSIELVARGHLFDGLVQLVACDKTNPGGAMARRPPRHPGRPLLLGLDRTGPLPAARGVDR